MSKVILLKNRLLCNLEDLQNKIKNNQFKGIQGWHHSYVGSDFKRISLQVRKDLIELEKLIQGCGITFSGDVNE
jgi:hypothetical protein